MFYWNKSRKGDQGYTGQSDVQKVWENHAEEGHYRQSQSIKSVFLNNLWTFSGTSFKMLLTLPTYAGCFQNNWWAGIIFF